MPPALARSGGMLRGKTRSRGTRYVMLALVAAWPATNTRVTTMTPTTPTKPTTTTTTSPWWWTWTRTAGRSVSSPSTTEEARRDRDAETSVFEADRTNERLHIRWSAS